ncbi:MAG: decarboxylating 6-phosphogluconate dehydrogenase [Candidatus Doudnabacteria bacterium]|nr:decarboxylating 6-phosphogluconate dehydrogenase [Candidatus Doudnabacteria bacterium]
MQIAIFGLGKMGAQIARRLHKNSFNVLAWNRSEGPREEVAKAGVQVFAGASELINSMKDSPRIFWLMLPHTIVEEFLQNQLSPLLKPGDIVIDGGNSFYKESIRRGEELQKKGIHFYDCGTSGGVWGEQNGFALMVGGPKEQWSVIEPVMKALSSGENYGLLGKNGAGHFVKMAHNGIEYGMMEAIAEGYGILQASDFNLDLLQVTKIYQEGTVIRSWLIDLTRKIFEQEVFDDVKGEIAASGEGEWTVKTAKELGVDVRVIEAALKVRQESTLPENQNKFSNKLVALLRKQFGGHGVNKK